MKKLTATENDSGQRLDRYILKNFPKLPKSLMFKEIRKKNIKVNRKRCEPSYIVCTGDVVELYLKDDVLEEKIIHYDFMRASKEISVIYEDENIILLDKKPGMLCHPDGKEYTDTLIARVKRYLYEKGEWNPADSGTFTPSLANRIDRNTGGIVIGAKNSAALRILNKKIKEREIEKHYLTAVNGLFDKEHDTLISYLTKNEKTNTVKVYDSEIHGSKKIVTEYTVLDSYDNKTLLDIDLKTGRTHQIRAHLAHIGHPLVDDGKYGENHGRYRQALYSYKLIFNMKDGELLDYLNGKEFTIENCEVYTKFKERLY